MAPAAGVNVPAPALNVPPLPVNLVHVPPASPFDASKCQSSVRVSEGRLAPLPLPLLLEAFEP